MGSFEGQDHIFVIKVQRSVLLYFFHNILYTYKAADLMSNMVVSFHNDF